MPKTNAERQRERRKRIEKEGLKDYTVTIPDTPEAREAANNNAEKLRNNHITGES